MEFDLIIPVESGLKQGPQPPRLLPIAYEDKEGNGKGNQT